MLTCLIGEADPFIAQLLRRFAEESGLRTIRARVGQEMLELARQTHPDVIIVDAELPGLIRGWEAVQAIHADRDLSSIPVINCCWLPESDVLKLSGGTAGYLRKPDLHYDDFTAALSKAGIIVSPRPAGGSAAPHNGDVD